MFLITLVAAIVLYSFFTIFASRAAGKVDDISFNFLLALATTIIFLPPMVLNKSVHFSKGGVLWTGGAAILIAAYTLCLIKLFSRGDNVTFVAPAIYGGVVVLTSIIGWVFLKERAAPLHFIGVLLIVAGLSAITVAKLRQ